VAGFAAAGCQSSDRGGAARAPAEDIPGRVAIPGGSVTTGEALGTLRAAVTLDPYSISTTPVTVGQYEKCVGAGACRSPSITRGPCALPDGIDGPTYSPSSPAPERPVTCVNSEDASRYCQWVGGRLPRISEWLLAARGPSVQRFPWGPNPATCAERPNLHHFDMQCCGVSCASADAGAVAQHPAGNSPNGLADVLLTVSEVVTGDPGAAEPGCRKAGRACLVTGLQAGAIDHVVGEPEDVDSGPLGGAAVTSFRCVWEGAGR
jgi:formylglycine-generating enzyme required for sulfatase activity